MSDALVEFDRTNFFEDVKEALWQLALKGHVYDESESVAAVTTTVCDIFLPLVEALEFYADPESYFGVGFWTDPPCGGFQEDFSDADKFTEIGFHRDMPGKKAREALGWQ